MEIKKLELADIPAAMRLSRDEGWNQTEKDWRMILENPDNICIAAFNNDLVIGTSNVVLYGTRVAWVGMVLIDSGYRRQGIGNQLFSRIISYADHVASIKLDATPAGYPLYKKSGFEDDYTIFRMVNPSVKADNTSYKEIKQVEGGDFEFILKYDEKIFGAGRSFIISRLYRDYPGKAFFHGDPRDPDGFIMGRDGANFCYLGPLYAGSTECARILLGKALQELCGKAVALDIPAYNEELLRHVESLGFEKQRYFTRMYLKNNDFREDTTSQYLICGPEFG